MRHYHLEGDFASDHAGILRQWQQIVDSPPDASDFTAGRVRGGKERIQQSNKDRVPFPGGALALQLFPKILQPVNESRKLTQCRSRACLGTVKGPRLRFQLRRTFRIADQQAIQAILPRHVRFHSDAAGLFTMCRIQPPAHTARSNHLLNLFQIGSRQIKSASQGFTAQQVQNCNRGETTGNNLQQRAECTQNDAVRRNGAPIHDVRNQCGCIRGARTEHRINERRISLHVRQ